MEKSVLPETFKDEDKAVFESSRGYVFMDQLTQHIIHVQPNQQVHSLAAFFARQQQIQHTNRALYGNATALADSNAWLNLEKLALMNNADKIQNVLTGEGALRQQEFTVTVPLGETTTTGENMVFLDASKSHVRSNWKAGFAKLLTSVNFEGARAAMFAGEPINTTENRSVLHVALREMDSSAVVKDMNGDDVMPKVRAVRDKMKAFSEKVRSGAWTGHTGKRVRYLVNIGIGGSDLGPVMATEALKPYCTKDITPYFVSNVDGAHMATTLEKINPEETLFIVASKTFTTQETLQNARIARAFLLDHYGGEEKAKGAVAKHFIALSTNAKEVEKFGIDTENMFEFWDWVGGRYSMWSAIGMPICLCIGYENFAEMLTGANIMDQHFRNAPAESNLPVMLAMTGIYYGNFRGCDTHAVLPYSQFLHRFPAYLQQLDMESNGKSASKSANRTGVDVHTGPIIFGEPGTNGQHAFYQLIHQGTRVVPCDFIGTIETHCPISNGESHKMLMANMFAQAEALVVGKTINVAMNELNENKSLNPNKKEALVAHKAFPGDRPSNTILLRHLTPRSFGALVAAYEHKVFTQGVVWGINSYDQWGVELGKVLTNNMLGEMVPGAKGVGHDHSTNALLTMFNASLAAAQAS
uniref:Glucose-6-phosphate isomerase n=1 Tax=Neobodo designis TaxID=312471 RepID=A0A7S1KYM6_NEODS|mmetsp:Transcript_111/g.417  ORF Transcript_111/g.417 Transcript_111/m.417 type:complete len:641 (+) Transcript_111:51-1973(+)|eukprot:CAMPEP_0174866552 /NCGR_PEP_ID=MMETSP1114-20130205/62281_1 /TAXON_ID=312471 /ORGANISM="Neobodo designis, Strain CCAP 1951/1" /LENGTH=640 /DNA_ID=CAMNT_0016101715 /DNA_START=46 /DNA_END=1968 /DNA_ORIENTATION=-